VRPEAPIGGSHQAKVAVVDRVLDASSGTFGVRLELPNADRALPAGARCRVDFPKVRAAGARAATTPVRPAERRPAAP
jgi:hypothetical protein